MNPKLLAAYRAAALGDTPIPPPWSDSAPVRPAHIEQRKSARPVTLRPSIFKPRESPIRGIAFQGFYPNWRKLRPRPSIPTPLNRK